MFRAGKQLSSCYNCDRCFQYDEEAKLPMPIDRGTQLSECREEFRTWFWQTYPDAEPRMTEQQVWKEFKGDFFKAHPEHLKRV